MTKRENFLRLMNNDNPGWIGQPWDAFAGNLSGRFAMMFRDPISASIGGAPAPGTEGKDAWGVTFGWVLDSIASHPHITDENKALKDITNWREEVIFPKIEGFDWSECIKQANAIDRNENMLMLLNNGGLFERSHYLMGFEDALVNYMLEQEAMYELLSAIADWKIQQLTIAFDRLKPDLLHFHDDWGSKQSLFMAPDVWRKIVKPHYARIYKFVKEHGVILMHHADCICEPVVEDMVELGIDIWQGVIPQNDILKIQEQLNGRMALMGGIDAAKIDKPNYDEAEIRAEIRRVIDTYCPAGYFIPCMPNIVSLHSEVERIVNEELISYGAEFIKKSKS